MNLNRLNKQRPTILIADDVHEILVSGLAQAGFNVLYLPEITRSEIISMVSKEVQGLVIRSKTQIDAEVLAQAKHLQFIARAGAGMDNIDEVCAKNLNIAIFNAGEANADAVGEHTLGMLLMLLNNLSVAHQQVQSKIWLREANRGHELAGKTVGIIGFGNTGKAVAKKLSGFDVNVLAYDKYLKNYGNKYAKQATLNQIFNQAHIVSFHVPLTSITQYMVNLSFLNRFKHPIYVLNLSRGKILKTSHLVKALKSGKVLGAALDVLENENLNTLSASQLRDFNFLANSRNVVLSPHIGGWTYESYFKISKVLLNKILTFYKVNFDLQC
jgi:D-3-phosphoglycerate dehydrogenase